MDMGLIDEPSVSIAIETLRVGDEIFVHSTIGFCLVSGIERHGDHFVVAYFLGELENYGRRRNERRLTEKQLACKPLGEVVLAKRGAPVLAEVTHRKMRDQQQHRWSTIQSKSEAG